MKKRRGQSIIEAMVALSILIIGFLGTIALINRSIGLNRVVADNYTATYLAAEGIEVTKNLIDGNYLKYNANPFVYGFALCLELRPCEWEVEYDTNWETNPPVTRASGRQLWYDDTRKLYTYSNFGEISPFTRIIKIYLVGGDQLVVNSEVTWRTRGGGISTVNLEDRFYNWFIIGSSTTP